MPANYEYSINTRACARATLSPVSLSKQQQQQQQVIFTNMTGTDFLGNLHILHLPIRRGLAYALVKDKAHVHAHVNCSLSVGSTLGASARKRTLPFSVDFSKTLYSTAKPSVSVCVCARAVAFVLSMYAHLNCTPPALVLEPKPPSALHTRRPHMTITFARPAQFPNIVRLFCPTPA